jgi:carbonic anhydrase
MVARAGERARDLFLSFIFLFHHFTAEPQRLPNRITVHICAPDVGPSHWGSLTGSTKCGSGTSQSPIDIVTAKASPSNLPKITFSPAYFTKIPGVYLNNGETGD